MPRRATSRRERGGGGREEISSLALGKRTQRRGTHSSIDVRPVNRALLVAVDAEAAVDALESAAHLGPGRNRDMRGEEALNAVKEGSKELGRGEEDEVMRKNL
jgi:hypothetical protein